MILLMTEKTDVEAAQAKVAVHTAKILALPLTDPKRIEELRILGHLRVEAANLAMAHAVETALEPKVDADRIGSNTGS
jgi:hypothetical protein